MMLDRLKTWYDGFRGAGDHAITVPPMDGALRPNTALDEARTLFDWPSPDNVATDGDTAVFSSGAEVLRVRPGEAPVHLRTHPAPVTALAAHQGALATALATGEVLISGGPHDGQRLAASADLPISCPVALAFRDGDTLLIGNGSDRHDAGEWRHDLLTRTASGSVWQVDLKTGAAECLARNLAWPRGLLPLPEGVLVSEAWRARLVVLRPGAEPDPVSTELPAYPGGLSAAPDGGVFVSLFAPRRRLTELVMRETAYRDRMMAEIEPEYWISPSLRPMESYYEPLQGGTLKKLAMLKPWAPSRSYGLVLELDSSFDARRSFHSRADGTRHGISSTALIGGTLVVAATGGDVMVALDMEGV
ncbi:hypothetical protein [Seohaeicola zhoushanensis]|uniref:Strictosidine synthase n=1 Tax=Seohaeicola zhoushanensis TaxID=1569283 RepID=A0A8J3H281_9RHOB|nr:hypothetical protein [Seohaeicola zhoushanensis]GHF67340.1 hypothetical protein GCM10017056_43230 [Seohaeicola zhoushanensis]